MKGITVFDFDGTLTRKDTFGGFAIFSVGRCRYYAALARESATLLGWKMGIVSNSHAKERLFSRLYKGMDAEKFDRLGREYADQIDTILRRDTRSLLRAAKQRGDTLVVVTASINNWVAPWALRNGFDTVIATGADVNAKGKLSGKFSTPNCHGEEKVRRFMERFPDRKSYTLTVYGDSKGDARLLHEADSGMKV